jgi:hypothetical protein
MLSKIIADTKSRYQAGAGLVGGVFNFFKGRSTFFALFFTVTGTILAIKGTLTPEYVALITAIQTLVVGHSWKEDAFAPTQQNVINNVVVQQADTQPQKDNS